MTTEQDRELSRNQRARSWAWKHFQTRAGYPISPRCIGIDRKTGRQVTWW